MVEIKKVESPGDRQVTFSNRKKGLIQKADQLSCLTDTEIAVVIVSECGRVFGFGNPRCDAVADRYLAGLSPNQNANVHTIPSKGSPIRVLEDKILDNGNLDLAPDGNADYQDDIAVVESMIVETTPSYSNFPQTTPLRSSCSEIRVLKGDGYLNLMTDTVSPTEPLKYQEGTDGSEAGEMSGKMLEEMIEEMMNETMVVPGCNDFMTNLVRALLPTTTSSCYTSLLITEDEDELIMDNRGLGTCYFNPYEDWRCGGICH